MLNKSQFGPDSFFNRGFTIEFALRAGSRKDFVHICSPNTYKGVHVPALNISDGQWDFQYKPHIGEHASDPY